MARKKRDTSGKHQALLKAAIDAFIEFGFEKTSMDQIAGRANASKRTLYNHFASKEALIEEAFKMFLADASQGKNIDYDPDQPIEDQLSAFADSKMQLTQDPKQLGLMRVILSAFISHPQMAHRAVLFSDSLDDGLIPWLQKANQDGRLTVPDATLAARVFWSLFAGTFFWPPLVRGPVKKAEGQKLKTEFIKLFLARYQEGSG
ncbi:MAG: TetR/AcrR family transcriptional regulator [Pseudomonadota bacterium]